MFGVLFRVFVSGMAEYWNDTLTHRVAAKAWLLIYDAIGWDYMFVHTTPRVLFFRGPFCSMYIVPTHRTL